MRHTILLFFPLLLLISCERENLSLSACGEAVTQRLGLVQDKPDVNCPLSVAMFPAGDFTYYMVYTPLCYALPRYYTCAGVPLAEEELPESGRGEFLGFLPVTLLEPSEQEGDD